MVEVRNRDVHVGRHRIGSVQLRLMLVDLVAEELVGVLAGIVDQGRGPLPVFGIPLAGMERIEAEPGLAAEIDFAEFAGDDEPVADLIEAHRLLILTVMLNVNGAGQSLLIARPCSNPTQSQQRQGVNAMWKGAL
jgi:hypothetical protein